MKPMVQHENDSKKYFKIKLGQLIFGMLIQAFTTTGVWI